MSDLRIDPIQQFRSAQRIAAAAESAVAASLAGSTDITGLAEFNERAGVPRHKRQHAISVPLFQRKLSRPVARRRAATAQAGVSTHEHIEDLGAVVAEAVDALHHAGKAELQFMLADFDLLERHTLLREMRSALDAQGFDPDEKERLKKDIDALMAELMDNHGDVIRSGLKNAQNFTLAVETMQALSGADVATPASRTVTELRALINGQEAGKGKTESPMTPLALARAMQYKFGAENFISGMGKLRTKMSAELRSRPPVAPGPRVWLSLSDAASFNAVQSSFAIAGDLRRDLSERAGIFTRDDQAATAIALLEVPEIGTNAAMLRDRIVDSKNKKPLEQMQACMHIRHAVEKLPVHLWIAEHLPQRLKLLEDLRSMAFLGAADAPASGGDADKLEKSLRGTVQRRKEDNQDQGGQGEEQEDGNDQDRGNDGAVPVSRMIGRARS